MSILIKGMEMPLHTERDGEKDTVFQCAIVVHQDNTAELVIRRDPANPFANCNEPHIDKCPLVEVPTPHGDLVDRDDLIDEINRVTFVKRYDYNVAYNIVTDAETIIEAEVNKND